MRREKDSLVSLSGTTILVVCVDSGVKREKQGGKYQLMGYLSSLLVVAPGTPGYYSQFLIGQTCCKCGREKKAQALITGMLYCSGYLAM